MKSSNPAGAIPARKRVRAWFGRLLCRSGRHHYINPVRCDLALATRGRSLGTLAYRWIDDGIVVGLRTQWTCEHCGRTLRADHFTTPEARKAWDWAHWQRRVLPRKDVNADA